MFNNQTAYKYLFQQKPAPFWNPYFFFRVDVDYFQRPKRNAFGVVIFSPNPTAVHSNRVCYVFGFPMVSSVTDQSELGIRCWRAGVIIHVFRSLFFLPQSRGKYEKGKWNKEKTTKWTYKKMQIAMTGGNRWFIW